MNSISFFDILPVIMDLFLGVIGTIIAVLQWRMEKRDRRKKKENEDLKIQQEELLKHIKQYASADVLEYGEQTNLLLNEILRNQINFLSNSEQVEILELMSNNLSLMGRNFPLLYQEYDDIKKIYRHMLKNESVFSLSYGYGRYIDAFREFITNYNSEIIPMMKEWLSILQSIPSNNKITPQQVNALVDKYKSIYPKLDIIVSMNKQIRPYLEELALGTISDEEFNSQDENLKQFINKVKSTYTK